MWITLDLLSQVDVSSKEWLQLLLLLLPLPLRILLFLLLFLFLLPLPLTLPILHNPSNSPILPPFPLPVPISLPLLVLVLLGPIRVLVLPFILRFLGTTAHTEQNGEG